MKCPVEKKNIFFSPACSEPLFLLAYVPKRFHTNRIQKSFLHFGPAKIGARTKDKSLYGRERCRKTFRNGGTFAMHFGVLPHKPAWPLDEQFS